MPEVLARALLPIATLLGVAGVLIALNWLLLRRRSDLRGSERVPRQVAMAILTLIGVISVVLTLPIAASSRNQIIGLIGLLVSAVVALSSTNIMANAMAGLLLRATRRFRVGDHIRVGEYAGRVTERGLFDTEVQSEFRELIAIPNTYIITNPLTTLRSSGALISCTLSLGFDIHHARIEGLLIHAAEQTGLEAPFVRIAEIGDFSVTYRVSGMLTDLDSLLTTRSNLQRAVLDVLHRNGVEIVSPNFMNSRVFPEKRDFIPEPVATGKPVVEEKQDAVVFDKAMDAEAAEAARLELAEQIESLEAQSKEASGDEKSRLSELIATKREELKSANETEPKTGGAGIGK